MKSALVERVWYGSSPLYLLLLPCSWLFSGIAAIRRRLYRAGALRARDTGRPVIVVGNIVSGGAGKTPVALWLAALLRDRGFRPGMVSRGYAASVGDVPREVVPEADPAEVGDEPLLMARRLVCPVVVHPDRSSAASMLVAMGCNVIVSDDGLQHYRLRRVFEIAVIDARRAFGNGQLLPAGPLREPVSRLRSVDCVMLHGSDNDADRLQDTLPGDVPCTRFELRPEAPRDLRGTRSADLEEWRGRTVHAVAGIGDPQRFFRMLERHGIIVVPHAFPDHAALSLEELAFGDELDVLMTEKDAVRLSGAPANFWYVPVNLALYDTDEPKWLETLVNELEQWKGPQE